MGVPTLRHFVQDAGKVLHQDDESEFSINATFSGVGAGNGSAYSGDGDRCQGRVRLIVTPLDSIPADVHECRWTALRGGLQLPAL